TKIHESEFYLANCHRTLVRSSPDNRDFLHIHAKNLQVQQVAMASLYQNGRLPSGECEPNTKLGGGRRDAV
ncbi:MAG: hypothetical protein LBB48_09635, partial [Treponema sp.]|nr:hypothetical protein [Treponema sp.]